MSKAMKAVKARRNNNSARARYKSCRKRKNFPRAVSPPCRCAAPRHPIPKNVSLRSLLSAALGYVLRSNGSLKNIKDSLRSI